jgi:hypothetical protein
VVNAMAVATACILRATVRPGNGTVGPATGLDDRSQIALG